MLRDFDRYRKIKFNGLPKPAPLSEQVVTELEKIMEGPTQENGGLESPMNETIPAGFTYLGQFITHDMIHSDKASNRIPTLQLRALYGSGPDNELFYVHDESDLPYWAFRTNLNLSKKPIEIFKNVLIKMRYSEPNFADMHRASVRLQGYSAIIADNRNDLNYILSQVHCAFAQFHNAVALWLHLKTPALVGRTLLEETQKLVIWHYQWIIVNQFLPMLVGDEMVRSLKAREFKLYDDSQEAVLMPEFSKAAFRIGHSQVREIYALPRKSDNLITRENLRFPQVLQFTRRVKLFLSHDHNEDRNKILKPQDEKNHEPQKQNSNNNQSKNESERINLLKQKGLVDLRGSEKRNEDELFMDWAFFFDYQPYGRDFPPQPSLAIDHKIAKPLFKLFFLSDKKSLPKRDLSASMNSKEEALRTLPAGESLFSVLKHYKAFNADVQGLTNAELPESMLKLQVNVENLPLWLYILLEAEVEEKGKKLGAVGSRIIAEQIMWVLWADKNSNLNQQPEWWPERAFLHAKNPDPKKFGIVDLLEFPRIYF